MDSLRALVTCVAVTTACGKTAGDFDDTHSTDNPPTHAIEGGASAPGVDTDAAAPLSPPVITAAYWLALFGADGDGLVVRIDPGGITTTVDLPEAGGRLVWSANGGALASCGASDPAAGILYEVDEAGPREVERVTDRCSTLAWSPKAVLAAMCEPGLRHCYLIDGRDRRWAVREIDVPFSRAGGDVSWSPAGSTLAVWPSHDRVWLVGVHTLQPVVAELLTTSGAPLVGPCRWSPTGRFLACAYGDPDGNRRVATVDATDSTFSVLEHPNVAADNYQWANDSWLVYEGDGLHAVQVDRSDASAPVLVQSTVNFSVWEATQGRLAYAGPCGSDGTIGACVAPIDDGGPGAFGFITDGDFALPSWAPDGRGVLFDRRGTGDVLLVDPHSEQVRQVTAENVDQRFWSPDSEWIQYAVGSTRRLFHVRSGTDHTLSDGDAPRGLAAFSVDGRLVAGLTQSQLWVRALSEGAVSDAWTLDSPAMYQLAAFRP